MSTKQPVSNKSSSSSNKSDNLSLTQKQKAAGLFQELNKFLAVRDYRQVRKVTNKILHTDGFLLKWAGTMRFQNLFQV